MTGSASSGTEEQPVAMETDVAYRTDVGYLQKIAWRDGTLGYCRRCDDTVAFVARGPWLVCPAKHEVHPANLIVNGQVNA